MMQTFVAVCEFNSRAQTGVQILNDIAVLLGEDSSIHTQSNGTCHELGGKALIMSGLGGAKWLICKDCTAGNIVNDLPLLYCLFIT